MVGEREEQGRAGPGWEGKAEETEAELRKAGRYLGGRWRDSRSRPTSGGLGSLTCLVRQVQHLLLLPFRQSVSPVCKLVLRSFNTD